MSTTPIVTVTIVVLYFACRWFVDVKSRRNAWGLRYL
jgi:hypothetical protein